MRPGRCVHFTGYQNGTCKAGVNYRDHVGGPDLGWAARLPCVPGSSLRKGEPVKCSKYLEPTKEEVETSLAEEKKRSDGLVAALKRINAVSGKDGPWKGTVECPVCNGTLHWTKAKLNNHIWGKCATYACLAWMM